MLYYALVFLVVALIAGVLGIWRNSRGIRIDRPDTVFRVPRPLCCFACHARGSTLTLGQV